MSFLQQNWRRGQNRFCLEARGMEGEREGAGDMRERRPKTMYTYMNK
jgi:hypothetical protein